MTKKTKKLQRVVFSLSVVVALVVLLGGFLPPSVRAGGFAVTDGAYTQMGVYEEVLRKIQSFYVVQPSMPAVTDGALHGMLESLDADSSYLTPAEYKVYKAQVAASTPATSEQVGLQISKRFGYATIVSVMPGSPADKQGIEEGDVIESIDGKSTHAMALQMIRLSLEGKTGTNVSMDVIVPGKDDPVTKTLQRGPVAVPAFAEQQYDGASILYLKPTVLTKERVTELEAKLKGMAKTGNKKVLLDLRDVSIGDELQGVRLANALVQSGTLATLTGQKYPTQTYTADASKFITGAPLIVLVNHGTAGAAEIVAASVLAAKRGDVLGDRTFGAGSIEKTIDLPDGSALLLTVAKYNAPDGKPIEDNAVRPNIPFSLSIDQFLAAEDTTAAAAVSHPKVDDQLNKALDVLKAKQS